jgi:hypothetical protein
MAAGGVRAGGNTPRGILKRPTGFGASCLPLLPFSLRAYSGSGAGAACERRVGALNPIPLRGDLKNGKLSVSRRVLSIGVGGRSRDNRGLPGETAPQTAPLLPAMADSP